MTLVWPLRFLGLFGTQRRPIAFAKDDPVPWWLELVLATRPHCISFKVDCETFFDCRDGCQHVFPLEEQADYLIQVAAARPEMHDGFSCLIVGAPTYLHLDGPRRRRRTEPTPRSLIPSTHPAYLQMHRQRRETSTPETTR